MKKTMILAGALALALLAGCSAGVISSEDGPTQVVGVTTTADMTPAEQVELVKTLIDAPVEELYEAIGQPEDSAYASSCLGEGEDGELYYEGFTVYTYRDPDGSESVYDVMEAPSTEG